MELDFSSKPEPSEAVTPGTKQTQSAPPVSGSVMEPPQPSLDAPKPRTSERAPAEDAREQEARLNRTHAETNWMVADTIFSLLRQLAEFRKIADDLRPDIVSKAKRLKRKRRSLEEMEQRVSAQEKDAQEKLNQAADFREQGTKAYHDAGELKKQAEEQERANREKEDEWKKKKEQAESDSQRAEELNRKSQAAETKAAKDVEDAKAEHEKAKKELEEATKQRKEAELVQKESERLQAQLWPSCLRGEEWRPWREEVFRRAAAGNSSAVLLARLHTLAALEGSGDLPLEVLRDLGRLLYRDFKEYAEKLADALNQGAGGRFAIKKVQVGGVFDQTYMHPNVAHLDRVASVEGWAVFDGRNVCQYPAEVS